MSNYKLKNSLFKKLLITYGLTIAISFTVMALLLIKFFDSYFIENKKELLIHQAQKFVTEINSEEDLEWVLEYRDTLEQFLDAGFWIVRPNGVVYIYSSEDSMPNEGQVIDEIKMRTLYRGYYFFERGDFGGALKEQAITIGYPIFEGETFKGAVIIHAFLPELNKTLNDIYKATIGATLLAMLLAYIGLYFQIKRISQPLKEISEAARKIASGEFQKRLSIDTQDEIEELGRSFNHMAESLEKIEENRANLVANISHDLRTPMTSIIGFIEGILDGTIPPESHQRYLSIILEESRRLVKITNDILELSNMQQGIVAVNKSSFELNETMRRRLLSFEKSITQKNLNVSLVIEEEKNYVYSDQILVDRVLQNLLDNAVKFTPENGAIEIKVSGSNYAVKVEILNTGVAINEEELKKVWDRFHKGDSSRGKHKSGFGLGLAIVREVMHQLDEDIWVESGEDFVRFTFTLTKEK